MQPSPNVDPKIAVLCITGEMQALVAAYNAFKALDDDGIAKLIAGEKLSESHHQDKDWRRGMVMHHVWMISRFLTPDVVRLMEQRAND